VLPERPEVVVSDQGAGKHSCSWTAVTREEHAQLKFSAFLGEYSHGKANRARRRVAAGDPAWR